MLVHIIGLQKAVDAGDTSTSPLFDDGKPAEHSRCKICNRKLTDDVSRRRGIGPECWEKVGHHAKTIRSLKMPKTDGKENMGLDFDAPADAGTAKTEMVKPPDAIVVHGMSPSADAKPKSRASQSVEPISKLAEALKIKAKPGADLSYPVVSRLKAIGLAPTCSRCLGTGRYSYNQMDGDRCYGCSGLGYKMPKTITSDLVAEATAAIEDGKLEPYLQNLRDQESAKKAIDEAMAAWKATGVADRYDWRAAAGATSGKDREYADVNSIAADAYQFVSDSVREWQFQSQRKGATDEARSEFLAVALAASAQMRIVMAEVAVKVAELDAKYAATDFDPAPWESAEWVNPFATQYQVDCGSNRGQGKRSGGMIRGAMGDPPRGIKTYTDQLGKLEPAKEERLDFDHLNPYLQKRYLFNRSTGMAHDDAMRDVYTNDPLNPVAASNPTRWRSAVDETTDAVQAIENEWQSKNYVGPTAEQQDRIDSAISDASRKFGVPHTALRRAVYSEPVHVGDPYDNASQHTDYGMLHGRRVPKNVHPSRDKTKLSKGVESNPVSDFMSSMKPHSDGGSGYVIPHAGGHAVVHLSADYGGKHDHVKIDKVEAFPPGKGIGAHAMQHLTGLADQHGTHLALTAEPVGSKHLNTRQLKGFYGAHGFKSAGATLMRRLPTRLSKGLGSLIVRGLHAANRALGGVYTPPGAPNAAPSATTPADVAEIRPDVKYAMEGNGMTWHQAAQRTEKSPTGGRDVTHFSHLLSHASPKLATTRMHAHLLSFGHTVSAVRYSRMKTPGGVKHVYQFQSKHPSGQLHSFTVAKMDKPAGMSKAVVVVMDRGCETCGRPCGRRRQCFACLGKELGI